MNNIVQINDNNLIAHQCEDANELLALQKKINNLAYAELNKEIENHYNHAETPTVTREEIDKKTREAAIRLGYITE